MSIYDHKDAKLDNTNIYMLHYVKICNSKLIIKKKYKKFSNFLIKIC